MTGPAKPSAGTHAATPGGIDAWSRLWALLSGRLALAWIVPALVAAGLALALPQLPSAAGGDPALRELWLSTARTRIGPLTDQLAAAGFLAIERTAGYHLLLAASLLSALLGVYESVRLLAAHWPAPAARQAESFFAEPNACAAASTPAAPGAALARLAGRLRRRGFRLARESGTGVEYLAGDRIAGRVARVVAQSGLLLLIAGLTITAAGAWRTSVLLTPGQSAPLAGGTGDVLRLDRLGGNEAQLALNRAGQDVALGTARAGLPLWLYDSLVRAGADGPAVRVTGEDANGQPVQLQSCPTCAPAPSLTLVLSPDAPERSAYAPAQALILVAERLPGADTGARLSVLYGASDAPVQTVTVTGTQVLVTGAAAFRVSVVRYVGLDVYRAPGAPLAAAGLALGLLGLLGAWALPPRRVWVLIAAEKGATLVKVASDDPSSARLIAELLEDVKT